MQEDRQSIWNLGSIETMLLMGRLHRVRLEGRRDAPNPRLFGLMLELVIEINKYSIQAAVSPDMFRSA